MTEKTTPASRTDADDQIDPNTGEPWASPLPEWQPTGEAAVCLDHESEGAWMVWTRGSCHLWDIRRPYPYWTRLPGAGRSLFVGDVEPQRPTRVDRWPVVGCTHFLWFDDPDQPSTAEQWRQSSTIRHIERVERVDR